MSEPAPTVSKPSPGRIFLVIADDTDEMRSALRYACRRAQRTRGRVALLHVIEPEEFQHWLGVGEVMEDERRHEAERWLQILANEVYEMTGTLAVLYLREGRRRDEVLALLDEEPAISILVLGTASGRSDPGPLVSHLVANMGGRVRTPVTLIPGHLSVEAIDASA